MVIDKIQNINYYVDNDNKIAKALKYISEHDFSKDEKGVHKIEGDNLFYVVVEYKTKDVEQGYWESHKKYIDIHYMIKGEEKIMYSNFNNMKIAKDYDEKDDVYILKGNSQVEVTIKDDSFLLCYPQDVHMTGIKVEKAIDIRKIIFKIKI